MVSIPCGSLRGAVLGALCLLAGCGRLGFNALTCGDGPSCREVPSSVHGDERDGSTQDAPEDAATSPGDGDAGPDGHDGGSSPLTDDAGYPLEPTPRCGTLELLRESFAEVDVQGRWFSLLSGVAQTSVTHEHLVLAVGAGQGTAEASYHAQAAYDLRDSALQVELLRADSPVSGVMLRDGKGFDRFSKPITSQRGVALAVVDGELVALTVVDDSELNVASAPYDASQHRHLRLREKDGVIHWETSANGQKFSTFHSQAVTMDTSHVYTTLFARGDGAGDSESWFDNVNQNATSSVAYCPVSSLEGDFDDGKLSSAFVPWNGAGTCTVRVLDARVTMDFPPDFSVCALKSSAMFSLHESAIAFELHTLPGDPSFVTRVELSDLAGDEALRLEVEGGETRMIMVHEGQMLFSVTRPYDALAQRFFRLRESDGHSYWESSADGIGFEGVADVANVLAPVPLFFSAWGFQAASASARATVSIDDVNRL